MAYLLSQPSPISPHRASQDFFIAVRQRLRSVPRLLPSPSRCTFSGRNEFVFCEPRLLLLTGSSHGLKIRDCEPPIPVDSMKMCGGQFSFMRDYKISSHRQAYKLQNTCTQKSSER